MVPTLLERPLATALTDVSDPADPASGGAAAATTCALAAALVTMAARASVDAWPEAAAAAAQAEGLQRRARLLMQESVDAYERARSALRPRPGEDPRPGALGPALDAAAEVPLRVCTTAADVAILAADVAANADGDVRADAAVAGTLAAAAARGAAHLVAVNLAVSPEDPRRAEASSAAAAAREAAEALLPEA